MGKATILADIFKLYVSKPSIATALLDLSFLKTFSTWNTDVKLKDREHLFECIALYVFNLLKESAV